MCYRLLLSSFFCIAGMSSYCMYGMELHDVDLPSTNQSESLNVAVEDFSAETLEEIYKGIYKDFSQYKFCDMQAWFGGCIMDPYADPATRKIQQLAEQCMMKVKNVYEQLVVDEKIVYSPGDTIFDCVIKMLYPQIPLPFRSFGLEIAKSIINACGMTFKNKDDDGLLHMAVRARNKELIVWLLQKAHKDKLVDFISMRNNKHETALGVAYAMQDSKIVEVLVENGMPHAMLINAPSISRQALEQKIAEELN